ncbi:MAG: hypothetical protein ACRCX5_13985 [Bacteroidales bacterium]
MGEITYAKQTLYECGRCECDLPSHKRWVEIGDVRRVYDESVVVFGEYPEIAIEVCTAFAIGLYGIGYVATKGWIAYLCAGDRSLYGEAGWYVFAEAQYAFFGVAEGEIEVAERSDQNIVWYFSFRWAECGYFKPL